MRPGGGKAKGHGFETQVSQVLSLWWGEERSFCRTPGSGAWSKLSGTNETRGFVAGDIITPKVFPFVLECKKDKVFEFLHLLTNPTDCTLTVWLNKLVKEDCVISGKKPMLIFSRNNWKIFCIIKNADYERLKIEVINFKWKEWVILKLEDLLSISKDEFLQRLKEENGN